jgi:zeaxanthin glucosyltransferase
MSRRRFLFVTFSDSGHVNPLIAVAHALEARGHAVLFASIRDDITGRLAGAGLEARCTLVGPRAPLGSRRVESSRSLKLGRLLSDAAFASRWLELNLLSRVAAEVEALRVIVGEWRPDVVASDPMAYAGPIAATLEDVPWGGLSTGLFALVAGQSANGLETNPAPFSALAQDRERLFASFGVAASFRAGDTVSPFLNIAFTSDALVSHGATAFSDVHYVGSALPSGMRGDEPPFPWERLPRDRPIVYVAFGGLVSPLPHIYRSFLDALDSSEAFFVVSVKDLLGEAFVRDFPDHVLAVDYAPQLAMLDRASAMVNHGGANSVMECLTLGKPMIVVPFAYDQHLAGHLVERAGAGHVVDAGDCDRDACRRLLLPLLGDGSPARARARELGRSLEGGATRAANLLCEIPR